LKKVNALLIILFLPIALPIASAQSADVVEIRLDTAIQYPNDRPINIVVEGMAFADDKPSRTPITVTAELRWPNSTLAQVQEVSVNPGIRTTVVFDKVDTVGLMYIYAWGEVNGVSSTTETQRARITYAPQKYTAGFLEGGRFLVTPLQDHLNLTVSEYLDDGNSIVPGRTFFVSHGNDTLDIEAPKGYLAVRYSVQDENGWMNYERSEGSGLTVHGTPYVWIYGDLERVQPFATILNPIGRIFGFMGALLILIGCASVFFKMRDESLERRKKAGTDNMPGYFERRRERKIRQQAEQDYWRRNRRYDSYDPYRRRY
tara:strand:+ start:1157 stop:2104 length:948 start_codon:yes stop_codon:yes gene_type:complete